MIYSLPLTNFDTFLTVGIGKTTNVWPLRRDEKISLTASMNVMDALKAQISSFDLYGSNRHCQ